MKKVCKVFLIIAMVSLLFSCRRSDIDITQVVAQPYIRKSGEMGLSVYLRTSLKTVDKSTLTVTDPSEKLTWTLILNEAQLDGIKYYGSSDISMPKGSVLPKGKWSVELNYKDGRSVSTVFDVDYSNEETVLSKYKSIKSATFDAESNLTLIP